VLASGGGHPSHVVGSDHAFGHGRGELVELAREKQQVAAHTFEEELTRLLGERAPTLACERVGEATHLAVAGVIDRHARRELATTCEEATAHVGVPGHDRERALRACRSSAAVRRS
jgi:hypothetical protein